MLSVTRILGEIWTVSAFLIFFSGGPVSAETGQTPAPEAVELGKQLYEKHCQVCHRKHGVGEPPIL
jgi:mono/diheme cytochrome c family protein